MVRRYKKSKREREAAKKRHLTPAERRKKEKHKKNRELRQRKLLELQQKNENNIKSCFSVTHLIGVLITVQSQFLAQK
ncbi:hypothetical protein SIN_0171 [Streptococcus infantis SK1302]|uniref:Uncharacterized protein n=1 Tax=Streptococcus infantis SK1302 TaxID=871237 RepID=A0ABP2JCX1_9STRE|nr:hypothetical protein SIN_0171 [Streptococcus infantis SK1302]